MSRPRLTPQVPSLPTFVGFPGSAMSTSRMTLWVSAKLGAANGTAIGPMREVANTLSAKDVAASKIIVMEGEALADSKKAALVSGM